LIDEIPSDENPSMARIYATTRAQRGFSLMEIMLVMVIIGILASFAIPFYTRFSARAHRAEAQLVISHMRSYFVGYYQNNGRFPPVPSGAAASSYNPPYPGGVPVGQPALWVATDTDWLDVPSPDGACRLRYQYAVPDPAGQTLLLTAVGDFPGLGSYSYLETIVGGVTIGAPVETPQF
jgi:prepilin-type N-terminal cleavage/methylation domain-containing protein